MPKLILEDDTGNVREVELNGEVTIGRAEDNVVRLPERNISRHHVRITVEGDKVFVEDAGSSFGVYVDDELVQGRVELRPGKTLEFGDYKGRLVAEPLAETKEPEAPKLEAPQEERLEEGTRILKAAPPAREEETVISRPKAWNVVFLVVLVGIAVALGVFYFSITKEASEASLGKGVPPVQSVPHVTEQEGTVEESEKLPGSSEKKVEEQAGMEKPIVAEVNKQKVEEKAVKEEKPKAVRPEQKPEQKKEVAVVEAQKNLPQPKAKETATAKQMTKPAQEKPQGGGCVALVKQARDQGEYDRAVRLLNSNVCKGNPQVALLWDSLGNRVRNTNLEQACEWWKRAVKLTKDPNTQLRLKNKITSTCK